MGIENSVRKQSCPFIGVSISGVLTVACDVYFLLFWRVLQIQLPWNDPNDDHLRFDRITEFWVGYRMSGCEYGVNFTFGKLGIAQVAYCLTAMQKDQAEIKK